MTSSSLVSLSLFSWILIIWMLDCLLSFLSLLFYFQYLFIFALFSRMLTLSTLLMSFFYCQFRRLKNFLLEYNCFTILLVSAIVLWISHMYTCMPLLSLPPSPHSSHLGLREHSADLPALWYAAAFHHLSDTWECIYVSVLLSQFVPPPSPAVSTSAFSTSTPLFLPCK